MEKTLPKLFRHQYEKYGNSKVALREKDRGRWKRYSWSEYYLIVKYLALALLKSGLKEGEKVAIIGENKPHIYWFELAAQVNRSAVVGIFSDSTPEEVKYFVTHSDSTFVICQDQEQVDKILNIKEELPLLKKIIYWEKKGLWSYDDPLLMTFDQMLEIGEKHHSEDPPLFDEMINKTAKEDIAMFFYTSGTTSLPKAAIVNQRSIIGMAEAMQERIGYSESDQTVSYLPVAWVGEQLFNMACSLTYGFTVNFPERQETVPENIREVGPTILNMAPRGWEDQISMIRVKMQNADRLNRLFTELGLKLGYLYIDNLAKNKKGGLIPKILYYLADKMVFQPLRDRLGLANLRKALTAGSAISPDVLRYFQVIGVELIQIYGSSEMGVSTAHQTGQIKPETCGSPLAGYEVKIDEKGEILIKSPYLFQGYYKNLEKTKSVFKDGWYLTGDFGKIDEDGQLIVMDRLADLKPISGDKYFPPQFSETRLRFSPYIRDIFVVSHQKSDFACAIVNIDYDNVAKYAEKNHIAFTTFMDLSQKRVSVGLVGAEIQKVNQSLPEWGQIRKFINLHKELDPDENEMTRTKKVRRSFLEEKYSDMIQGMFGDESQIDVEAAVRYRDGSVSNVNCSVSINQVDY